MKPQNGWFDGRTMIGDSWGRKWHFLRREHADTYWSACGPLWLASAPQKLAEAPPADDPVCRKCASKLANEAIHLREGAVRSACGRVPADNRCTTRPKFVTCGLCLRMIQKGK